MGQRYGAERPVVVPDSKGWNRIVRLKMQDGSTPRVRVLDPKEKNIVQVRLLVPVTKEGKPTPESREITVTRAYWDANAKSTFLEGLGRDLALSAALFVSVPIAIGAGLGYASPSYGAARGAGAGAAFVAGTIGTVYATSGKGKSPNLLLPLLVGAAAATGTAVLVRRR
jgi:hypothetical protein